MRKKQKVRNFQDHGSLQVWALQILVRRYCPIETVKGWKKGSEVTRDEERRLSASNAEVSLNIKLNAAVTRGFKIKRPGFPDIKLNRRFDVSLHG